MQGGGRNIDRVESLQEVAVVEGDGDLLEINVNKREAKELGRFGEGEGRKEKGKRERS